MSKKQVTTISHICDLCAKELQTQELPSGWTWVIVSCITFHVCDACSAKTTIDQLLLGTRPSSTWTGSGARGAEIGKKKMKAKKR